MVYDGTHEYSPMSKIRLSLYRRHDRSSHWMDEYSTITYAGETLLYVFRYGATHAPHHAPKEYVDKYKGKFSQGWDKVREETLARQKALGVVPKNTVLARKPKDIKDWVNLTADEKRLFEKQMEVFAGFAEHTDHEVGRLVAALDERGELENTIFFYVVGDNGSSAEGGMIGMFNENNISTVLRKLLTCS